MLKEPNSSKDKLKELVSDWRYVKVCLYVVFTAALLYILSYVIRNMDLILSVAWNGISNVLAALSPFFIGIILAYLLSPLVDFIDQKFVSKLFIKLPENPIKQEKQLGSRRTISILLTFLIFFALVCLVIYAFAAMIMGDLVFDSISGMVDSITNYFLQYEDDLMKLVSKIDNAGIQQQLQETISSVIVWISSHLDAQSIINAVTNIGGGVVNFILGIIISIYLLKDKDFFIRLWRKFNHVCIPMEHSSRVNGVLRDVDSVLSKFIRGQLLDSLIIAIISSVALTIIGIDFAVFIGCFAGVCNIIPYFGPVIGMIPAVSIGLLEGGLSQGLLAFIVLLIIQQIDGNIIYPKVVGGSMGLHPVFVLIAVTFGGYFWGILGMILAVPILAVIQMFLVRKLGSMD